MTASSTNAAATSAGLSVLDVPIGTKRAPTVLTVVVSKGRGEWQEHGSSGTGAYKYLEKRQNPFR